MGVQPPASSQGFWASLDPTVKVIATIVGIAVSLFGLYAAYDKLTEEQNTCRFSGTAYVGQAPARGAFIGYETNRSQVGPTGGESPNFVKLGDAGADGTFAADCGGIDDGVGSDSFEVLTKPGSGTCPGLPHLGPETIYYSSTRIRNRGDHPGINLQVHC